MQFLGKEKVILQDVVDGLEVLKKELKDVKELLILAEQESDEDTINVIITDLDKHEKKVEQLEFQRMFNGRADANNAYMDIQSGSGGTEAQDWASMLLRMYLRLGERHGFKTECQPSFRQLLSTNSAHKAKANSMMNGG